MTRIVMICSWSFLIHKGYSAASGGSSEQSPTCMCRMKGLSDKRLSSSDTSHWQPKAPAALSTIIKPTQKTPEKGKGERLLDWKEWVLDEEHWKPQYGRTPFPHQKLILALPPTHGVFWRSNKILYKFESKKSSANLYFVMKKIWIAHAFSGF